MYGASSKNCEINCQCSGLITDNFRINSGNSATKRKQNEAFTNNFKLKMSPHTLNFNKSPSPVPTPKRRVLGELQMQSPLFIPKTSPTIERLRNSPTINQGSSPVTTKTFKRSATKINRIFEERTNYKMNKENLSLISETFVKLDMEEETRDCSFVDSFRTTKTITDWSTTKLDFTDTIPTKHQTTSESNAYVPVKGSELVQEFDTLHDLEEEFLNDNFDECTKYEIISTDSPNIISRGRPSTSRKVTAKNFTFGAPIADLEQSESFNKPMPTANRMLVFEDERFEFTSPATKKTNSNSSSVKKSLKFSDTPTKNPLRHEQSDSSIGSMSFTSPASSRTRVPTLESTTSMESGFLSELEEPFLDLEDASNSPKMANFNELLSGQIKNNILTRKETMKRPQLTRSLSLNPESSKVKMSLFSILENPGEKRSQKRTERTEDEELVNKRRKAELISEVIEPVPRPSLQRAYSENHASIMSALARSAVDPDLIGDFSQPFALPLTIGDHDDLKSISCDTLAGLLRGDFQETIHDFQVIDCRYPYEFEGGHVKGALNMYTPQQMLAFINKQQTSNPPPATRSILVFHCEFSLERGPKLSRFLRSSDRAKNKENYPSLHYPEVYLLHEGYRAFYQKYPDLCSPTGYTAMLDPQHKDSLRKHRSVSQPSSSTHHRRNRLLL